MSTQGTKLEQARAAPPRPKGAIELYSPTYFATCTLGGIIGEQNIPSQLRIWRIRSEEDKCKLY